MLIGRKKQKNELLAAYNSQQSEFVAVYGRRRIGKTFLIRQTMGMNMTFSHAGIANGTMQEQLFGWCASLRDAGFQTTKTPKNWLEAFELLKDFIRIRTEKRKVIFIDEMPWMDTPRSKFVNALEFFWNGWASGRDDILLIVCGSATSWIINKIFKNHGGLHNRVTRQIYLEPFTLAECEEYAQSKNLVLSRYDLLEAYMAVGGVPYYWSQMERGKSLAQNIDELFFSPSGKLHYEYNELYRSLFHNPDNYLSVIQSLARKKSGLTRDEIVRESHIANNGNLTQVLDDLVHCSFIRSFNADTRKQYKKVYQLIDNFTLFHLHFMVDNKISDSEFWEHNYNSSIRLAWTGLAFERVCFQHIPQIKKALGINGISSNVYPWRIAADDNLGSGVQIDMLIDRADNTINLCEMKFADREFYVDKDCDQNLRHKFHRLAEYTKHRKTLQITLITTYGIEQRGYWNVVQNTITMEELFSKE